MANTTNLNLEKPIGTDQALVSVINSNMDKIDTFAGSTNQAINTLNSKIIYKDHNVTSITIPSGKEAYMNIGSESGYYPITVTGAFTGETATSISVLNPTKNPNDGSWIARLHNSHSADVVANGVVTSVWIKR